jgi:SAM-dependent methyltransferase
VDRWEPERSSELFPEVEGATFTKPDLVIDLNRDALEPVASQSEDFIVCCHVLEHLANPLRAIDDVYRVLRPGGTLLILLPDRRRTFDKDRLPTELAHVVADFQAGIVEVDDDHIIEFLTNTGTDGETLHAIATDPQRRAAVLDVHRHRSVHVHCWTLEEFVSVIRYSIEALDNQWLFVDGVCTEEQGPQAIEFGLVLRRSPVDLPPADAAKLFTESFEQWHASKQRVLALEALAREMQALLATKTFRYTARLRHLYGHVRRRLVHR